MNNAEPMQVLWTGGWDSSARVLELVVHHQVPVQTHYIINPERRALRHELRAMGSIRAGLGDKYPNLSHLLLPTAYVTLSDLRPDPEVAQQWAYVRSHFRFARQYEWINRYRIQYEVRNLEIGVHGDDRAPQYNRIRELVEEYVTPTGVKSYRFPEGVDPGPLVLLAPFTYPILWRTKHKMGELATEQGYRDLLEMSWFCQAPIGDAPCGMCLTCRDALRDRMDYRLTLGAKIRNRFWIPVQAFRALKSSPVWTVNRLRERIRYREWDA